MTSPSEKVFFMDSLDWNTPGYRGAETYRQWGETAGTPDQHGMWAYRHVNDGTHGVVNMLFFDGHVEGLTDVEADPTGPNGWWQIQKSLWWPYKDAIEP